ncbi:MAG: hypothetical protein Q8L84_15685, partial [Hyphomonas sp.]|nr:hypothetical protein [Hyphomonas sp.]
MRKEWAGVFQRLDPDGVYSFKAVFAVGASSVSASFILPQPVAIRAFRMSIFSHPFSFILIFYHAVSVLDRLLSGRRISAFGLYPTY